MACCPSLNKHSAFSGFIEASAFVANVLHFVFCCDFGNLSNQIISFLTGLYILLSSASTMNLELPNPQTVSAFII